MSEVATQWMSERDATQLTEKIRITAHNYADARQKLQQYVAEAKAGNAHLALGYASWTAYLSEVLGEEPMRLARGERQEMVQMLSAEGMSTRAIAPIVGVHHDTVASDIRTVGNPTVEAEPITGVNGKTYGRSLDEQIERRPPNREAVDDLKAEMVATLEPRPKRPPLPEQFFNTIYDLTRNLDRLKKLTEDDRYPANKEKVALKHESDLQRLAATLAEVLQTMNNN